MSLTLLAVIFQCISCFSTCDESKGSKTCSSIIHQI